jgi:hypothetical protein
MAQWLFDIGPGAMLLMIDTKKNTGSGFAPTVFGIETSAGAAG